MHHSSVQGVSDPASTVAAVGGHPGAHSAHEASFFASSDAASRYYQMHYESAASQGNNFFKNVLLIAKIFFVLYHSHKIQYSVMNSLAPKSLINDLGAS